MTTPRERPILFNGPMVQAILAGTKTQTRRVVKTDFHHDPEKLTAAHCPHGNPGDRLWVRETWCIQPGGYGYRADNDPTDNPCKWRPSIHMPRIASRITLDITAVRVNRLQDITTLDIIDEGVWPVDHTFGDNKAHRKWIKLWDSINGKKAPWASNPWVWVIEFVAL